MNSKITQLKFIETLMRKTLFIVGSLLVTGVVFGQTTAVDFEVPSEYAHAGWEGLAEVVVNPNSSGINTSTNVGKYTTPANKSWGNASVVTINTALDYADLDNLQFKVIAPSASQIYVKLEHTTNGGVAEASVTPIASSDWQLVTLNFSLFTGVDGNTATYDKFTFFFNVNDNVGGEVWSFDDIVANSAPLSIDDVALTSNGFVYPNPVNDVLTFKSNNTLEDIKISIYSITGQLIKKANEASVNVEDIKTGLYIATIENKQGQKITKRFIKK